MDTSTTCLIGPLYHGTRDTAARTILREGFRRSRSRSYTGTGICLSESLTVAYEYGMYEAGGCVLEARLAPNASWTDRLDSKDISRHAWDEFFAESGMDAVRGFGGNVWVVWNPAVLVSITRLTQREAIQCLCPELDEDGHCGATTPSSPTTRASGGSGTPAIRTSPVFRTTVDGWSSA
jgi:hypothetical protein